MLFKNRTKHSSETVQAEERHDEITVLVMEYQNLHQRVVQHVETGRQNTLQALIFAGAVIVFSVNCFYDVSFEIFVNLSMCVILPLIAFSLVISMLTVNIKICSYGEYLSTIEQRINKLLHYSTDSNAPADKKIVDWERWRRTYGIAQEKAVFFDGYLLYAGIIIGAFLSFLIRLIYLNRYSHSYLRFWALGTPLLFAFFLTLAVSFLKKLQEHTFRVSNRITSEGIAYGKANVKDRTHTVKIALKNSAIFAGTYVVLIILLFASIPFSFYIPSDTTNWIDHQVIAHRGLHNAEYPENTLGAFSNAILHGYAIELDIWFSSDGIPVVIHDKNVSQLCQVNRNITDMSFEEIRQLMVLNKEKIPTLQEALELINGDIPVIIEIKPYFPSENENQVLADILQKYDGMYVIQSFSPLPLSWMKGHYPNIPRGQLYADWGPLSNKWIFRLRDNLFNLLSAPNFIGYDRNALPSASLDQARDDKIPIVGWLYKIDSSGKIDSDELFLDGHIVEMD